MWGVEAAGSHLEQVQGIRLGMVVVVEEGEDLEDSVGEEDRLVGASGVVGDHVGLLAAPVAPVVPVVVQDLELLVLPALPLYHQRDCLGHGRSMEVLGMDPHFEARRQYQQGVDYLHAPPVRDADAGFPRRTYDH